MSNLSDFIGGSSINKSELFITSGTWTFPTSIVKDSSGNATVYVTMIGGGGAGGGAATSGGGNGGEYLQRIPLSLTASATVTIGAAGAAGVSGAVGGDGGSTTFGSLTVTGGVGGGNTESSAILKIRTTLGAIGGIKSSGTYGPIYITYASAPTGPFGGTGGLSSGYNKYEGGGGGGLVLDDTGKRGANSSAAGGTGYGAGGAAGPSIGGAGASGAVLIEWEETI